MQVFVEVTGKGDRRGLGKKKRGRGQTPRKPFAYGDTRQDKMAFPYARDPNIYAATRNGNGMGSSERACQAHPFHCGTRLHLGEPPSELDSPALLAPMMQPRSPPNGCLILYIKRQRKRDLPFDKPPLLHSPHSACPTPRPQRASNRPPDTICVVIDVYLDSALG